MQTAAYKKYQQCLETQAAKMNEIFYCRGGWIEHCKCEKTHVLQMQATSVTHCKSAMYSHVAFVRSRVDMLYKQCHKFGLIE